MLPASNRGAGMNMGFPDVCNTIVGPATVPIPYPNMAMNAQASGFSPTVNITGMNALNQGTQIPMTSGDEAGTAHPTIKGGSTYTMGNPIVFIDGMPGINLACPTTANSMNDPLGAALVPSVSIVTYCDASRATPGAAFAVGAWRRAAELPRHGLSLAWGSDAEPVGPRIAHVRRGSFGFRLGARAGDRLVTVQGQPVAMLPSDEVLGLLEDMAAGFGRVSVARAGEPALLELSCAPSEKDSRALSAARLPGEVGYLSVHAFTPDLPALAHAELDRLARDGARSLVVDVRGNPGGELAAVLRLAGELVTAETVIVRLRPSSGSSDEADLGPEIVHRAQGDAPRAWPLVILVDRGTASAAELFAGALQDQGRATVVGERTYGKGSALSAQLDPRTAELRHWARSDARLPSGAAVEGVGIQPDLEVPPARGSTGTQASALDRALKQALEVAKSFQQQAQR